jgi:xanthosine utilization system XapX-like protein
METVTTVTNDPSLFSFTPLLLLLGVLLALPVLLKVLEQVLPLMKNRIETSATGLHQWMPQVFGWSQELMTDGGELSPAQAISQSVGAVLMMAFATAFIVCELQFTWATLCPMLGGTCTGEAFAGYDKLLAFSSVLLAIEFGVIATDLCGVTYTTSFARIERARLFFLVTAVVCCLLSIAVGGVMAWYRDLILGMGPSEMDGTEITLALQELQTIILISLAALLLIGAVFAGASFDTFCPVMLAAVGAAGGVGIGVAYIVLQVLALLVETTMVVVKTLRESLPGFSERVQRRMDGVRAGSSTLRGKLRTLVAPRKTAKRLSEKG